MPYKSPQVNIKVESRKAKNGETGNLSTKNSQLKKLEATGQKQQRKKAQLGLDQDLNNDIQQVFKEDEDIL